MAEYDIKVTRLFKKGESGDTKTEIWAQIRNRDTNESRNERIWWEDDEGVYHDGTKNLPAEIREKVDNAWLEKSRKW